jgi:hypothetical protein
MEENIMLLRKTYELIHNQYLSTYVMIGNKKVLVEFTTTNGYNPNIKGTFTTSNHYVIAALESSPRFGVKYRLKNFEEVKEDTDDLQYRDIEEKTEGPVPPEEKKEEIGTIPDLSPEVVSAGQVSNVQQAKEYLKAKYPELTARQLLNKAAVIAVADEKNIKFESIQS